MNINNFDTIKMTWLSFCYFFIFVNLISAQQPEVVISAGHTDFISSITMSSDGKWIASGSIDKSVKIIDAASGKELRTFGGHNQRIQSVQFDPTNRYISAYVEGESIYIYDVVSGKLIANYLSDRSEYYFLNEPNTLLYINSESKICKANYLTNEILFTSDFHFVSNISLLSVDQNIVFAYTVQGELIKYDLKTISILFKSNPFNGYKYLTCPMKCSNDGNYLALAHDGAVNGKDGQLTVFSTKDVKKIGVLKLGESRITDFCFDYRKSIITATEHNGVTVVFDVEKMKEISRYRLSDTFSAYAIAAHPFEDVILIGESNTIHYIDRVSGRRLKSFKALGQRIFNMTYDQNGKYLVTAARDLKLKIWDLEQNKIIRSFFGFFPVAFSPNGKEFVSMHNAIEMALWDAATGEKKAVLPTEGELIQNISFNKEGTLLAGAGFQGIVRVWDMKTQKQIHAFKGHSGGIYGTTFHPDNQLLASCGMDNTIRIWDIKSGKQIKQLEDQTIIISDVKFSPNGLYLASSSWDKTIKIYRVSDWQLMHSLEGHTNMITTIDFSADSRFLASGAGNNTVSIADNSVIVWDVASGKESCRYTGHTGAVNKVIFDKLAPHIYSTSEDGTVKVWDYVKCQEIATFINVGDLDYCVITPDNYYMASRGALDGISFRLGADLYPFEQFDLKFNRPDIVCNRLGKTPQGLINAYEYLYGKRLRKNGFIQDDMADDFNVPKLTITTKNLPLMTDQRNLKFDISAVDEKYLLNRINVFVNDVPVFGPLGIDLKTYSTKSLSHEIDLQLVPGENKIQVSVHNEKGVESLQRTFTMVYNNEAVKGNLYLVTIGVSNYTQSEFNLSYPTKDAKDIELLMQRNKSGYTNIYTTSLLDKDATKENISNLRVFLSKASIDDVVIIFIAGHGILDENYNYFFATHDIDFYKPGENGLPYEALESLLANTKAYRKLLIMDTCHSGELDKEEVEESKNEDVRIGDVQFRSVNTALKLKESFGVENVHEMMEMLFTDVRKGTGATVISSAGGVEFAMESDTWKNGLFTYCFINGLTDKSTDTNYDGIITVSEIRAYVYKNVYLLSKGRQKPTARSENLSVDFRVW